MLANTVKNAGLRNGVYDKLTRGWAEKFHSVENNEEIGSALVARTDERRDKNEASASCSDLQLGWALHKPRSQAVRFTDDPEARAGRESWQQSRSRKSGCRHENIKEPRWFVDV